MVFVAQWLPLLQHINNPQHILTLEPEFIRARPAGNIVTGNGAG